MLIKITKRTNTAVWLESQNRWQIKVQRDGIRKTFTSSKPGRTGQREANAKADAWLDEGIESTKVKVKEMSEKYMEQLKITTSQSHWRQYQGYFDNWINPAIGTIKVENLTEQKMQSVINKGYSSGLSKKTLSNMKACLLSFLKFCRSCKATTLFVEGLYVPKGAAVKEKRVLQPDDIKILFSSSKTVYKGKEIDDPLINAYRFQVLTGLRPGELIGLKWDDIRDGVVHLRRAINEYGEVTKGKNDNARRDFALNVFSSAVLEAQKKIKTDSPYVFSDKYGEPVSQSTYYKHWVIYRNHNGISSKSSPYELRHTFVSAVKTLPEGYLKQLVGHSKDMDTYGVYSHRMADDMSATASMVQEVFKNILS